MSNDSSSSGGGCGCVSLVLFILLITLLFFGLPTPWGKLNLDLLPPQLWDMNKPAERGPTWF